MLRAMGASVVAMVLMLVIGPAFIRWLRVNEFGQNIREEGPEGHKTKEGTPTMGGMLIWFAVLVAVPHLQPLLRGVAHRDDRRAGQRRHRLRRRLDQDRAQALPGALGALQAPPAAGARRCSSASSPCTSSGSTRASTCRSPRSGSSSGRSGFYALIFLTLAGFSNAVNLTDGLDGLAAGASAIVLVALAGIAFIIGRNTSDPGITDLMVVAGCVGGACLGFLWYNTFPADVFMGDTGSLGLGGAIAGMAVMTRTEFVLLIIGGLFVLEAGLGGGAGHLLQAVPPARAAHGAAAPPLRAQGLVGDQDHRALLDHRRASSPAPGSRPTTRPSRGD